MHQEKISHGVAAQARTFFKLNRTLFLLGALGLSTSTQAMEEFLQLWEDNNTKVSHEVEWVHDRIEHNSKQYRVVVKRLGEKEISRKRGSLLETLDHAKGAPIFTFADDFDVEDGKVMTTLFDETIYTFPNGESYPGDKEGKKVTLTPVYSEDKTEVLHFEYQSASGEKIKFPGIKRHALMTKFLRYEHDVVNKVSYKVVHKRICEGEIIPLFDFKDIDYPIAHQVRNKPWVRHDVENKATRLNETFFLDDQGGEIVVKSEEEAAPYQVLPGAWTNDDAQKQAAAIFETFFMADGQKHVVKNRSGCQDVHLWIYHDEASFFILWQIMGRANNTNVYSA